MYEIIPFKVSETVSLKEASDNVCRAIVESMDKDFNLHEAFFTLARSTEDYDELEIVQEEFAKVLPSWMLMLENEVNGFIHWTKKNKKPALVRTDVVAQEEKPDGSIVAKYEATEIEAKQGYVLLKDIKAIFPYIVLPMSVFVPYADKIVDLFNQYSTTEEIDATSLVNPGLFVEVYS